MANVGDILPHCTGTGTSSDPYKYSTAEGFVEAIAVVDAYVVAAEDNLVFDVNDGVIPNTISINNASLDGKGTTIRNLYAVSPGDLVAIAGSNTVDVVVRNINFYNMMIATNTGTARFVHLFAQNDYYDARVYNCNFTGIIRGSTYGSGGYGYPVFIGSNHGWGGSWFQDCTFNFNVDVGYGLSNLIAGSRSNYHYLKNCTINISGTLHQDLIITSTLALENCTIGSSSTNPLKSDGTTRTVSISPSLVANYNYVKLHLISLDLQTSGYDQKTLINRSLISGGSLSTSGISMQETDPTASDYIYNAENLANAGFLVGTVIE